jgi:hypothetical protein
MNEHERNLIADRVSARVVDQLAKVAVAVALGIFAIKYGGDIFEQVIGLGHVAISAILTWSFWVTIIEGTLAIAWMAFLVIFVVRGFRYLFRPLPPRS